MDFLGLGVTFAAIDNGLKKSVDETVMGFNKISDTMRDVEEAGAGKAKAKGGIFSGVIEGMKLVSISRIGSALEDIHGTMVGTQRISTDFFNTLESAGAKVRSALDPSQAAEFTRSMRLGMMTPEQLETLSNGILKFGVSGREASKVFPMMSDLVGKVGMDATQVATMFGQGLRTLRATPKQIKRLVKESVKMQKSFGLTDQLENLPAFFEVVTKNAAKFGKVNSDVAIRSVGSLSRLSMQFQKMGKNQDQAVASATNFADKLGDMRSSILDMQVGLEPTDESVWDLAEALEMAGISGQETMGMITSGMNPDEMMNKIRGQLSGLDEGTKLAVTQRLRRIFGDDVANMAGAYAGDVEKFTKDADNQNKKLGTADSEYDKLTKTLGGTLAKQEQLLDNQKELFDVAKINRMRGAINKYLSNQMKGWGNLTNQMNDNDSVLGSMLEKLFTLKDLGVLGFIDSSMVHTLGILAGIVGTLFFPLVGLVGLFKMFGNTIKMLLNPFNIWGKSIVWMGSKAMPGLIKKGDKISDVFRGIGMQIKERLWPALKTFGKWLFKWGSKLNLGFRAVGAFFMKWLVAPIMAGLASVAAFFGVSVGVVVGVIAGLVAAFVGLVIYWDDIKAAFGAGLDWIESKFKDFWKYIEGAINAFEKGGFSALGDHLIAPFEDAINSVKEIWNNFAGWFSKAGDAFEKGGLSGLWDFFYDEAIAAIDKILGAMGNLAVKMGKSLKDGVGSIGEYAGSLIDKYTPDFMSSKDEKVVPKKVAKTAKEASSPSIFERLGFKGDDKASEGVKSRPSMNQKGAPTESRRPLSIKMKERSRANEDNFQKLIDEVYDSKIVLAALLQELVKKSGSKVRISGDMNKIFKAVEDRNNDIAGESGMTNAVASQ